MLSRDFLLDDPGTEGANAFRGDAVEEAAATDPCDWYFGGYAIPLLDPIENHARGTARLDTCESAWTKYLNYHVNTTSTNTVYVRQDEGWRMYIQDARLVADDATAAADPATDPFPTAHPEIPDFYLPAELQERYPSDWASSGRFDANYISFVKSRDGGLSFPVYAPTVTVHAVSGRTVGACVTDFYNSDSSSVDWTDAGWTPTAIPCTNADTTYIAQDSTDFAYSIYRDVNVVDLYTEMGLHLMFAIECRSMDPVEDTGGCAPCTQPCDSINTLPYTRFVLFASTSPDFPRDDLDATGPFLWPDPRYHSEAMVLLSPEVGGDGPGAASPSDPNEWYGVPAAIRSPDLASVLVYVPWQGMAGGPKAPATLPLRVTELYGGMPEWAGGSTAFQGVGISAFSLLVGQLGILAWWIVYADRNGGSYGGIGSDALRAALSGMMFTGYQGEVLLTDGTAGTSAALERSFAAPRERHHHRVTQGRLPGKEGHVVENELVGVSTGACPG